MLVPNLSVLLAERRLTLSKVSEDTRISRTTLTALAGRSAKGIQFETLNTLCQYLKITPDRLFLYLPYDISLSVPGTPGSSEVTFTLRRVGAPDETFRLACEAACLPESGPVEALRVRLSVPQSADPAQAERDARFLALLEALPQPVLSGLELELLRAFDCALDPARKPDDYTPDLRWPWQP